ncbi:MAG: hypothetical protein E3J35_00645 [Methanomassiliicoccales archaeon]|nr:MAG: hypothetical protein E3J35_00645 [Methanomassiliicoccales archaeon]
MQLASMPSSIIERLPNKEMQRFMLHVAEMSKAISPIVEIGASGAKLAQLGGTAAWISAELSGVVERMIEVGRQIEKSEYGWLGFLTVEALVTIYTMEKEGKLDEFKSSLMKYHRNAKNVEETISELLQSDVIKPREEILRDAFDAHLKGRFTLSIPVFLSQLEGAFWDYGSKVGIVKGQVVKLRNGTETKLHSFEKLLDKSEIGDVYKKFSEWYVSKQSQKRNDILHGRLIHYADELDSCHLILALRVAANILR